MKFRDLLNEKFYNAYSLRPTYGGAEKYTEVYINPTTKEISELLKQYHIIRLSAQDKPNSDIYAWRGDVLHYDVKDKIPYDFSFRYDPKGGEYYKIWTDSMPEEGGALSALTNYKTILKKIGKIFKNVKYLTDGLSFIYDLKNGELYARADVDGDGITLKNDLTQDSVWNWKTQWIKNIEKKEKIKIK